MRKILLLCATLVVLAFAAKVPPAEASCPPSCDTYCPGKASSTLCGCPKWTDRPCQSTTCGSWNTVGGCWYE